MPSSIDIRNICMAVFLISQFIQLIFHQTVTSSQDLNSLTFDYIVVGAGTAGSTVASELATSMPDKQILLIEEGYYSVANPRIDDLTQIRTLINDDTIDKGYYSTPQTHLNNRSIHLPRARVTGGCGSHNGQIYIFANQNDFNKRWNNINGWSLNDLLPGLLTITVSSLRSCHHHH